MARPGWPAVIAPLLAFAVCLTCPVGALAGDGSAGIPVGIKMKGTPFTPFALGVPQGADTTRFAAGIRKTMGEKEQLLREWHGVLRGSFSETLYRQHVRAFGLKYKDPAVLRTADRAVIRPTQRLSGPTLADGPLTATYDPDYDLYTIQHPQQNGWYCGPASAQELLESTGNTTSFDGEALTQSMLAIDKYLETDKWGQTPWWVSAADQPYPQTLNKWRTGSYSGYYALLGSPDYATYVDRMQYDIDYMFLPIANDVNEVYNGYHLPGHPNTFDTIGHWIDVNAYHQSGAITHYPDSATSVWVGVPTFSDVSSSDMVSILQARGMVW